MAIVIAILVFSFLIIVHELGHYAAARLVGVKVIEFSLFMGPRLIKIKRGETIYSLKLIPIGGSCLMEGEETESSDGRALNNKPRWARAIIFFAGPFLNMVMSLILLLLINLSTGYSTNTIAAISPHGPLDSASTPIKAGDRIVSYGGKSVNTPLETFIYLQDTKGAQTEVGFVRNGEAMRTVVTPEYTPAQRYILGFFGAESYGHDWNLVTSVTEGQPAALLGIGAGDRLITVNGEEPNGREHLRQILERAGGDEVAVTWRSAADGETKAGNVAPLLVSEQESFSLGGLVFESEQNPGIIGSISAAWHNSISMSKMVLYSLKWIITGNVGMEQMSGPIGIVHEIGTVVEETGRENPGNIMPTLIYLANLAALIGMNLGLYNLIPFPPLDGSKLLLLGVEAIRRKDIPQDKQIVISLVGFGILIVVVVFTMYNDIIRIVTG